MVLLVAAPEALRNAGLVKALKSLALDVNDNGDINVKLYGHVFSYFVFLLFL